MEFTDIENISGLFIFIGFLTCYSRTIFSLRLSNFDSISYTESCFSIRTFKAMWQKMVLSQIISHLNMVSCTVIHSPQIKKLWGVPASFPCCKGVYGWVVRICQPRELLDVLRHPTSALQLPSCNNLYYTFSTCRDKPEKIVLYAALYYRAIKISLRELSVKCEFSFCSVNGWRSSKRLCWRMQN